MDKVSEEELGGQDMLRTFEKTTSRSFVRRSKERSVGHVGCFFVEFMCVRAHVRARPRSAPEGVGIVFVDERFGEGEEVGDAGAEEGEAKEVASQALLATCSTTSRLIQRIGLNVGIVGTNTFLIGSRGVGTASKIHRLALHRHSKANPIRAVGWRETSLSSCLSVRSSGVVILRGFCGPEGE